MQSNDMKHEKTKSNCMAKKKSVDIKWNEQIIENSLFEVPDKSILMDITKMDSQTARHIRKRGIKQKVSFTVS